jgi:hypothetical protein
MCDTRTIEVTKAAMLDGEVFGLRIGFGKRRGQRKMCS